MRMRLACILLTVTGAALLTAPRAHAQQPGTVARTQPVTEDGWYLEQVFSSADYRKPLASLQTPVSRSDLSHAMGILQLDGDQRAEVRALHAAILDEYRLAWVVAREAEDDLKSSPHGTPAPLDAADHETLRVLTDQLTKLRATLQHRFYAELAAVIDDDQSFRLVELQEARTRASSCLRGAVTDREAIDPSWAVYAAELDAHDVAIALPIIKQHQNEVDAILDIRFAAQDTLQLRALDYLAAYERYFAEERNRRGPASDTLLALQEKSQSALDAVHSALVIVMAHSNSLTDANTRAITQLREQLSPHGMDRFDRVIERAQTPDRYSRPDLWSLPSGAMLTINAALKIESLVSREVGKVENPPRTTMQLFLPRRMNYDILQLVDDVEPLTPEQIAKLKALRDDLKLQYEALDNRFQVLVEWSTRRSERQRMGRNLMLEMVVVSMYPGRGHGVDEPEMSDEEKQRLEDDRVSRLREAAEIDKEAIRKLRQILTLRQRAALLL